MGIKDLGFEEIKRRADKFREIAKRFPIQDFDIGSEEAEMFLEENPLAPIIGTICDQQITAENAWIFPYWLSKQVEDFSVQSIYNLGKDKVKNLLGKFMENRWPSGMKEKTRKNYLNNISSYIIKACYIISRHYNNDPDNMFKKGAYTVSEIYFILRTLPGMGPKKASMIARDFAKGAGPWYRGVKKRLKRRGIEFKVIDKYLSDVPVDVHVIKVFGRVIGEFKRIPSRKKFLDYWPDIQNFAKLSFPEFPGQIDEILWIVGRVYCNDSSPNCEECPLKNIPCEYAIKWRNL